MDSDTSPAPPPPCRCRPPVPDTASTGSPQQADTGRTGLLSQLTSFKKESLKNTETTVKTEDGRSLTETHDDSGNYKTILNSLAELGFIADCRLDLQVGQVRDNLLIGSQDVAADYEILKKYGVTHIVNIGTYVKNFFPNEIEYRNVKINDYPDQPVLHLFDLVFNFIDKGREEGCVFIHCNAGVSRASTFMIGYIMSREKLPLDEVFPMVKTARPAIKPNTGFLQQLRMFNEQLGFGKTKM